MQSVGFIISILPVSQIVSFNLFPPIVTILILKSTPWKHSKELNKHMTWKLNIETEIFLMPVTRWWTQNTKKGHCFSHVSFLLPLPSHAFPFKPFFLLLQGRGPRVQTKVQKIAPRIIELISTPKVYNCLCYSSVHCSTIAN